MHDGRWTLRPCPVDEARRLARELGVSEITAGVLVRRGYADPSVAAAFLVGEQPPHDPFLLGDMALAVERIRAAVDRGERICVHGDYDVDGICATALAVLTLREVGADVVWHLPSRFEEGYGVSGETIARLAEEGVGLVVTVDCGITAAQEVADETPRDVVGHERPEDQCLSSRPPVVEPLDRHPGSRAGSLIVIDRNEERPARCHELADPIEGFPHLSGVM